PAARARPPRRRRPAAVGPRSPRAGDSCQDSQEDQDGQDGQDDRADIAPARRVVVKVGSSSLTTADGGIDEGRIAALAGVLADRVRAGTQVVLVSSGAIAAGLAPLGLARRPPDLATQQAAAGVGPGPLLPAYTAPVAPPT